MTDKGGKNNLSCRGTNPHRACSHPPVWRMWKVSGSETRQPRIQPGSPLTNWAALSDSTLFLFFFYLVFHRTSHCNQPHTGKRQLRISAETGQKQAWPCLTDNRRSPEAAACPSPTPWRYNTRQIRYKHFDLFWFKNKVLRRGVELLII